jgi:hypothetical protein
MNHKVLDSWIVISCWLNNGIDFNELMMIWASGQIEVAEA